MNSGAVTEALARIFHDGKIQQRDVAIGVYGQSVIVRKITVPMMTPGELDEQIHWEAEQHIPFDIKLMSIDYEVLRRRPEAGQMDLLLVAAKKDEISDYAAILREAKLRPAVVDINAFTIQNIFEHQYGLPADGTIALLNLGAAVSSLNIVTKGVSAFTREITNAGNSITEEIRKALSCSYEQAEAYKHGRRRDADRAAGSHRRSSTRRARALAGEIQRSLDFYLATSGEQEIGRIYVSGGSAYLAPLVQAIERRARVPVQLFDPMVNLVGRPQVRERGAAARDGGAARRRARALAPMRQGAPAMVRVNLLPDRSGQAGRRTRGGRAGTALARRGARRRRARPSSSASSSRR